MFRADLKSKLSQIFGMKKTTFDSPSTEFEQETLFIEVIESKTRLTAGLAKARITGNLIVFAQYDKMPFGFFAKKIEEASFELKKNFHFHDIDLNPASSPARFQNISERRVSFTYLYSAQYDPEHGELTSLEGI